MAPAAVTVTMSVLLLLHATGRPGSSAPWASKARATRVLVRPTATLAVAGSTCTDATARGATVICAVPCFPWAAAVTLTGPPFFTPDAMPVVLTETVVASLLCQVNAGGGELGAVARKGGGAQLHEFAIGQCGAFGGVTSIRDTSVAAIGSQSTGSSLLPHPASARATSKRPAIPFFLDIVMFRLASWASMADAWIRVRNTPLCGKLGARKGRMERGDPGPRSGGDGTAGG